MENIIDKVKENKKIVIAVGIVLLVALASCIIAITVSHSKKEEPKEDLNAILKKLGTDFYEDFYYMNIGSSDEERATKLSRYETIGIKVDLDNLSRYNSEEVKDDIEKFVNEKTNEKCDKNNTKVIIYPKSPYGKTDYEIETKLECGFEE